MSKEDTENSNIKGLESIRVLNFLGALLLSFLISVKGLRHIAGYYLLIYLWIYIWFLYLESKNFHMKKISLGKYMITNMLATIGGAIPILLFLLSRLKI